MKTRIILTVLMIAMIMGVLAQKPTLTLTFTADNIGQNVPLNSILIENLTQGGDTTLYAPDTVLMIDYSLGLDENSNLGGNGFSLSQNFPNPMEGKTTVSIWLPERNDIQITISDVIGREVVNQEFKLEQGSHTFSFYPGRESLYFLTARADDQSRTIKMFNSPVASSVMELCKLEYNGRNGDPKDYKAAAYMNNFIFDQGDQLQYTASSALGDRTMIDTPTGNQTYTFQYGSGGAPCPGMPTITDIDGNLYNTVLIGTQCWMKENLKTTTFRNGTAIPNVTFDYEWNNLTTSAYCWSVNNISWKDKYGALYNWFTSVDTNELCPTGWHVPTNDEWTDLTNYIGGTSTPHGDELKSCRQVNSPLGGGCNTSEHPRWADHFATHGKDDYGFYGTDDYGFSGLPGGCRGIRGSFGTVGITGNWLSSTELLTGLVSFLYLIIDSDYVSMQHANKENGHSVRCLRDN